MDHILSRLEGVRQVGPGRWRSCCPVHEDRRPSFDWTERENGNIYGVCRSCGATGAAAVKSIGLPVSVLFEKPLPREQMRERARNARTREQESAINHLILTVIMAESSQWPLTADQLAEAALARHRLQALGLNDSQINRKIAQMVGRDLEAVERILPRGSDPEFMNVEDIEARFGIDASRIAELIDEGLWPSPDDAGQWSASELRQVAMAHTLGEFQALVDRLTTSRTGEEVAA